MGGIWIVVEGADSCPSCPLVLLDRGGSPDSLKICAAVGGAQVGWEVCRVMAGNRDREGGPGPGARLDQVRVWSLG
jgi:hypothetical protein